MRINKAAYMLPAALMMMSSCVSETPWGGSDEEGGIVLTLHSDGSILSATRASDSESAVVPEPSAFSVTLTKNDGSYQNTWSRLEDFNRETSFKIGDYTLRAFYGEKDREGFEAPYFEGMVNLTVHPGAEENVTVTAALANAMVSVRYTEAFSKLFPAYSAAVRSEGNDYIMFAQNEDRPAYVNPSHIDLAITMTNGSGKQVTVQPAGFTADPRYHYIVTIGVKDQGESGNLVLDVNFEENVVAETVEIELGDELFNAPAPKVSAKNFDPEQGLETFMNIPADADPRFHVLSFAGIRNAVLTVKSAFEPTFGKEIDLAAMTPVQRAQMEAYGMEVPGFDGADSKAAILSFGKFISYFPEGTHSITLRVTDALTRESEPLTMQFTVLPVEVSLSVVGNVDYLAEEMTVAATTNCPAIRNNLTFKVPDANGNMVDAEIKSIKDITAARAATYTYHYLLGVPRMERATVEVQSFVGTAAAPAAKENVTVILPEYSVESDAYANCVRFRITPENASNLETIVNNLAVYQTGNKLAESRIVRNASKGMITLTGLTPGSDYTTLQVGLGDDHGKFKNITAFTTENLLDVPNGDFTATTQTINIQDIRTGGEWTGTIFKSPTYHSSTSIVRSEATGWSSINAKTCWTGSANRNTWFLVPSTYVEDGRSVVRSVAYDHNGSTPAVYNKTAVYYNGNVPAFGDNNKVAGELFLGEYKFDGNETRTNGVAFGSRPHALSFNYTYQPYGEETAEVLIRVKGADGTVIAEKTESLGRVEDETDHTVILPEYLFGVKAATLYVEFRSTGRGVVPGVNVPSGSDLNTGGGLKNQTLGENDYKALATGSVLTVDKVKLSYDFEGVSTAMYNKRGLRK